MNGPASPRGWRGTWGPSGDARSRFGRRVKIRVLDLAEEILGEPVARPARADRPVPQRQLDAFLVKYPPAVRRRLESAARWDVLAERALDELGSSPRATVRAAGVARGRADVQLAKFEALAARLLGRNGHGASPTLEEIRARYAGPKGAGS